MIHLSSPTYNLILQLGGTILIGYLNKLWKEAVRIMTCVKYNAHTDPIFQMLKLLKIQDLFNIQNLKIYYKYKNIIELFKHVYIIYWCTFSMVWLEPKSPGSVSDICYLYQLIILPCQFLKKVERHTIDGFSSCAKACTLENYESICYIRNCYICEWSNRYN